MNILRSVFCKHPIFGSTKRFFNKDGHRGHFLYFLVPIFFFKGLLKEDATQKNKIKIHQMLS